MEGDPTLFVREDAVEAAWKVVDGILDDATPGSSLRPGNLGAGGGGPPDGRPRGLARPRREARRSPRTRRRGGGSPTTTSAAAHWNRWGPYLSARAWGTVREDYSPNGTAWDYFPHDHARSRAYRWNEDGLAGHQRPPSARLLRARPLEREGPDPEGAALRPDELRGQSRRGRQGVLVLPRLDAHPLVHEGSLQVSPGGVPVRAPARGEPAARTIEEPEFELLDTGIFEGGRYFDVFVEYAKASPEDMLIEITVLNRGPEAATLDLLPTVWFRNTWSWNPGRARASLAAAAREDGHPSSSSRSRIYGKR